MDLIVGLGNPGGEYRNTRHNTGFLVVECLQNIRFPKDIVIKKSSTFMNESGDFVEDLVDKYKINLENLYIVHDDLDIRLGEYKIQFGRGPKDHNGLKSIDDKLGTDQYWHVRVGVDNRPLDNRPLGEEYVLQDFTDDERRILDGVVREICKKLATSLTNTN